MTRAARLARDRVSLLPDPCGDPRGRVGVAGGGPAARCLRLRGPLTSRAFAEATALCGDAFVEAVETVVEFVVGVDGSPEVLIGNLERAGLIGRFPQQVIDLVNAITPENPQIWEAAPLGQLVCF